MRSLPTSRRNSVAGSFFETMGMRLLAGRLFAPRDDAAHPRVVVVNETTARRYWSMENPVGRRVRLSPDPEDPLAHRRRCRKRHPASPPELSPGA
jgi:hypothetical protein